MINKVGGVSFNGVYDIKFPKGTSDDVINKKLEDTMQIVDELYQPVRSSVDIRKLDYFAKQDTSMELEDKGIRIATAFDNPYILTELFDRIGGSEFSQQYIDKTRTELILDVKG